MCFRLIPLFAIALVSLNSHAELTCNPIEIAGSCATGWNTHELRQTLQEISTSPHPQANPEQVLAACKAIWDGKAALAPSPVARENHKIATERLEYFSARLRERLKFPMKKSCVQNLRSASQCLKKLAVDVRTVEPQLPQLNMEKCMAIGLAQMKNQAPQGFQGPRGPVIQGQGAVQTNKITIASGEGK